MRMIGSELAISMSGCRRRWFYRVFGHEHIGMRMRRMNILRILKPILDQKQSAVVFEAGIADGRLCFHIAKKYPWSRMIAVGLDADKVMQSSAIAEKLRLPNLQFIQGDLNRGWPNSSCDIIICSNVLEDINGDDAVLRNFYRMLMGGGFLILHVPHLDQHRYFDRYLDRNADTGGHVRNGYSVAELSRKLIRERLEIINQKYTCGVVGELGIELYLILRPHKIMLTCFFAFILGLCYLDTLGLNTKGRWEWNYLSSTDAPIRNSVSYKIRSVKISAEWRVSISYGHPFDLS